MKYYPIMWGLFHKPLRGSLLNNPSIAWKVSGRFFFVARMWLVGLNSTRYLTPGTLTMGCHEDGSGWDWTLVGLAREECAECPSAENDGNEGSNFSWWIFLGNLLKIGAGADPKQIRTRSQTAVATQRCLGKFHPKPWNDPIWFKHIFQPPSWKEKIVEKLHSSFLYWLHMGPDYYLTFQLLMKWSL